MCGKAVLLDKLSTGRQNGPATLPDSDTQQKGHHKAACRVPFSTLLHTNYSISHCQLCQDFWISKGYLCYLCTLTKASLSRAHLISYRYSTAFWVFFSDMTLSFEGVKIRIWWCNWRNICEHNFYFTLLSLGLQSKIIINCQKNKQKNPQCAKSLRIEQQQPELWDVDRESNQIIQPSFLLFIYTCKNFQL